MRTKSRILGIALAAALALGLVGCVEPAPVVIPTSQPDSKPVFATDAAALAAAKKAYVAYLAVSDEVLEDKGANPTRLLRVATPGVLKTELPGFAEAKARNWRSTGGTVIDNIELQSYSPDAPKGRSIISVYACIDVSKVGVFDAKGHSVVSPGRPPASTFQATFDLVKVREASLIISGEQPWQGTGICK
jgi:hypothetical protein